MTETEIVNLYWQRSELAIDESNKKYGKYCFAIAYGVLGDGYDADESVNDTWLSGWNSMPPKRPDNLKAYFGKLCRHISISKLRKRKSQNGGGGEAAIAIEELEDCIPDNCHVQREVEMIELGMKLNVYLGDLGEKERNIFVARYWYALPVCDIALKLGLKESTVKTSLFRSREKLKKFLEKEGW